MNHAELPLPPILVRPGERLVCWTEPGDAAGAMLVVESWERNGAAGAARVAVSAEAARRTPGPTAHFIRLALDAQLVDRRSVTEADLATGRARR